MFKKQNFKFIYLIWAAILSLECECKNNFKSPYIFKEHKDEVSSLVAFDDHTRLVSGSYDKTIRIWDTTDNNLIENKITIEVNETVYSIVILNDGIRLVAGLKGKVNVWNVVNRELVITMEIPSSLKNFRFHSLAVLSDGIIAGGSFGTISIWNVNNGTLVKILNNAHTSYIRSLLYLKEINSLASTSNDGKIVIWNVFNEPIDPKILNGRTQIKSMVGLYNGTLISSSEQIIFWNIWSNQEIKRLKCPNNVDDFNSLAVLSENRLASSSLSQIIIWNIHNDSVVNEIENEAIIVSMTALSNNRLATGSADGTIKIWSLNKIESIIESNQIDLKTKPFVDNDKIHSYQTTEIDAETNKG